MSQPGERNHGRLRYADPGYLADGERRMPLTSYAAAQAASDRLDGPEGARYTAPQRKRIRDRIRKALAELGGSST